MKPLHVAPPTDEDNNVFFFRAHHTSQPNAGMWLYERGLAADRRDADLMLSAQIARAYQQRGLRNPFPGDIDAGGKQ